MKFFMKYLNSHDRSWSSKAARKIMFLLNLISFVFLSLLAPYACAQIPQDPQKQRERVPAQFSEKESRSSVQRKISSDLLDLLKGQKDRMGKIEEPSSSTHHESEPKQNILVDIRANVTESLLEEISKLGGTVINSYPQYQSIRAKIPLAQLEPLAESSDIKGIRSADNFQLHR